MDHCTVICTGNSLRGFDLSKIHGYTIGVNYAYQHVNCDMVVARDNLQKIVGEKIPNIETLSHLGGKWTTEGVGVNRTPGMVTGYNCSLTTALNIAIHKGFKKIYILGCDNRVSEFIHFYDIIPHDWTEVNRYEGFFNNVQRFMEGFKSGLIDEQIITVESSLGLFEDITLDQYAKRGDR